MTEYTTKKEIIRELRKSGKVFGTLQNSLMWIPIDKATVIALVQANDCGWCSLNVLDNGEKEISINPY